MFFTENECCCVQNIVTSLQMFLLEFDRKMEEKLQDSLHLIWPLKCNIFFRLSSSDNSSGVKIGLPSILKMAACCLPFVPPRNAAVLKRRWPRTSNTAIWASRKFAGPYVWSLLPVFLHNSLKKLCWICLMALRW